MGSASSLQSLLGSRNCAGISDFLCEEYFLPTKDCGTCVSKHLESSRRSGWHFKDFALIVEHKQRGLYNDSKYCVNLSVHSCLLNLRLRHVAVDRSLELDERRHNLRRRRLVDCQHPDIEHELQPIHYADHACCLLNCRLLSAPLGFSFKTGHFPVQLEDHNQLQCANCDACQLPAHHLLRGNSGTGNHLLASLFGG